MEVESDAVKAVDPDSWEEREAWLIVWLNPERLFTALLGWNTGAALVLER